MIFFLLIPILIGHPYDDKVGKGLAMAYPTYQEDLSRAQVNWFYDWSSSHYDDPRYVPMSWCGADPELPLSYSGYVLLFNEPELKSQCNITSQQGIDYYKSLQSKYPEAKWVVGNTIFWGSWQYWLNEFWDICHADPACVMPEYWGVHVYLSGDARTFIPFVKGELNKFHNKIGGIFWVTEFSEINGNINTDRSLVKLYEDTPYIARWAYFTNRSAPNDPWYLNGWRVDLFDWDTGEPTAIGNWYIGNMFDLFLSRITK